MSVARSSRNALSGSFVSPPMGGLKQMLRRLVYPLVGGAAFVLCGAAFAGAPTVRADQARIVADAVAAGGHGPTVRLVADLRRLRVDVGVLPSASRQIEIRTALGNAEKAGARSYTARARIYRALGLPVG